MPSEPKIEQSKKPEVGLEELVVKCPICGSEIARGEVLMSSGVGILHTPAVANLRVDTSLGVLRGSCGHYVGLVMSPRQYTLLRKLAELINSGHVINLGNEVVIIVPAPLVKSLALEIGREVYSLVTRILRETEQELKNIEEEIQEAF